MVFTHEKHNYILWNKFATTITICWPFILYMIQCNVCRILQKCTLAFTQSDQQLLCPLTETKDIVYNIDKLQNIQYMYTGWSGIDRMWPENTLFSHGVDHCVFICLKTKHKEEKTVTVHTVITVSRIRVSEQIWDIGSFSKGNITKTRLFKYI